MVGHAQLMITVKLLQASVGQPAHAWMLLGYTVYTESVNSSTASAGALAWWLSTSCKDFAETMWLC